jgi:hypothetical protein
LCGGGWGRVEWFPGWGNFKNNGNRHEQRLQEQRQRLAGRGFTFPLIAKSAKNGARGNGKSKGEMQRFFAPLRMINIFDDSIPSAKRL